jgi:hypothetical protein
MTIANIWRTAKPLNTAIIAAATLPPMTSTPNPGASKATMVVLAASVVASALLLIAWYLWSARANRRRANEIMQWIDNALAGHGHICALHWITASRFAVPVRLRRGGFSNPAFLVQLPRREWPLLWVHDRLCKAQPTVTFSADLDIAPRFNLQVHHHRWCGRTTRHFTQNPEHWVFHHTGPYILTSRSDWHQEILNMMGSLIASREGEFLRLKFQRNSPNIVATAPLESISPCAPTHGNMLDVLRELASEVSASRF